ncbi:helicase-related protein [Embleya sp. NBC_00896]|uniref:helicase-related protein n=1 Tax=Embleya sp. NBC_00896 TaxID=2975961 RepID=UPI002F916DD8|nr:helicase-related protein [Embleya sp. NBC_00896]
MLRVAADQALSTVIAYHARTAEAEACAETLPAVAQRLHEADPLRYPAAVWADWLCGEHEAEHRRRVLGDFAAHTDRPEPAKLFELPDRGEVMTRRAVLSNVRVLAEGVDLRADAVAFMDPKLSVIEIVQAIGRVLRQEPHEGRTATLPDATTPPSDGPWTGNAYSRRYDCTSRAAEASTNWCPDTPSAARTSAPGLNGNGAAGRACRRRSGRRWRGWASRWPRSRRSARRRWTGGRSPWPRRPRSASGKGI